MTFTYGCGHTVLFQDGYEPMEYVDGPDVVVAEGPCSDCDSVVQKQRQPAQEREACEPEIELKRQANLVGVEISQRDLTNALFEEQMAVRVRGTDGRANVPALTDGYHCKSDLKG
jgi:hypothetical protein